MLTPNQIGLLKPLVKWACIGLVGALLVVTALFYYREAKYAEKQLQATTADLIALSEEHDRFVREQTFLLELVKAGQSHKQASQERTNEAISEHRSSGNAVHLAGSDLSIMQQRSREVRANAVKSGQQSDKSGGGK